MKPLDIKTIELQLEAGPYTWPGRYPIYFITVNNAALSFKAVKENIEFIKVSHKYPADNWTIVAIDINWENENLICAHTNKPIPSAYGGSSDA